MFSQARDLISRWPWIADDNSQARPLIMVGCGPEYQHGVRSCRSRPPMPVQIHNVLGSIQWSDNNYIVGWAQNQWVCAFCSACSWITWNLSARFLANLSRQVFSEGTIWQVARWTGEQMHIDTLSHDDIMEMYPKLHHSNTTSSVMR
jgi:hypothetical protein